VGDELRSALLEAHPDAVVVIDPSRDVILDANTSAARLLQLCDDEVRAGRASRFFSASILSITAQTLCEHTVTRPDGGTVVLEIDARPVHRGGEPVILAILRDVADRARVESGQVSGEDLFRSLFDNAGDAIFIHDREGYIIEANRPACERLGYSREELLTMHPRDFNTPEQAAQVAERLEVLRREGVVTFETTHVARDGTLIPTEVNSRFFEYRGVPTLLSTARDHTQRKRSEEQRSQLEEQLRLAQKMEAMGTLSGGIAHDFRNLLQVIQAHAELLSGDNIDEERRQRGLQRIVRATQRGADLTFQLLAYSRKVESDFSPMELNREVVEVQRFLKRSLPKMIDVEIQLNPRVGLINGDPAQIEQVLLNLALNAGDAMPTGGRLLLQTDVASAAESGYSDHPDGDAGEYAVLRVSDTGCGMDEETMQHIFDPFFSMKPVGQGTGLGLSTAYGIIEKHKGHVTVKSTVGVGTSFTVYFPLLPSDAAHPSEDDAPALLVAAAGQGTVLLVDDEKALVEPAEEYLSYCGYNVLTASTGEEALKVFVRPGERVDLVVLDLGMPGMGGHACLEKLIELDSAVPVIVASGNADLIGTPDRILEAGAKLFIPKPYLLADMELAIRHLLA